MRFLTQLEPWSIRPIMLVGVRRLQQLRLLKQQVEGVADAVGQY